MLTYESNSLLFALLLSTFILIPVSARSQDDITSYKLSRVDGSTSTIVVKSRSSDHSELIVSETTPDTETQNRQVNAGQETEATVEAGAGEADAEVTLRVMYLNHSVDYQRRYNQDVPEGLSPVQAQALPTLYESRRQGSENIFGRTTQGTRWMINSPHLSSLSSEVLTALASNPQPSTILMLPIPPITLRLNNEQWRNRLETRLKMKLLPEHTLANMPWIYTPVVQTGDNETFTVTGEILLEVEYYWNVNRRVPVTALFVADPNGSIRMERFEMEGILTVTHTTAEGQLQNVEAMDSLWNEVLEHESAVPMPQNRQQSLACPTLPENSGTTEPSGSGINEPETNEPVTEAPENTLSIPLLEGAMAVLAGAAMVMAAPSQKYSRK